MTNTPLNPDDEDRLKKALEQSANGQVVSRGSFAQYVQTQLNPEAVRAGSHAGHYAYSTGGDVEDVVQASIYAYAQAVAQPLVTSLEELDAMPDGSVVKDSVGEVYIMTPYDEFWRVWGNYKRFSSCEIVLPARVLHLPEVKP